MGVSPSGHEPVRIAPMARRGDMTNALLNNSVNGCQYDRGSVYDDHSHSKATAARGATAAYDHDDEGITPRFSTARARDETRNGSSGDTAADEVCQNNTSGFVVDQSSERLSAAESMSGGGAGAEERGRAGGDQMMGALRAGGVAAESNAAKLLAVGHDEWKEACTAQGKM